MIKSGKISASRTEVGGWLIDASEFDRVRSEMPRDGAAEPSMSQSEPGSETSGDMGLQVEVKLLREMLADRDEVVRDLRQRLDAEVAERQRLTTMLIADQRPRRWWQRRPRG